MLLGVFPVSVILGRKRSACDSRKFRSEKELRMRYTDRCDRK